MLLIITPGRQMENGTLLDKVGCMINLYTDAEWEGNGDIFYCSLQKYRSVVNCKQK